MFACGPADAAAIQTPHYLLPHLNLDWFYLSGTGLPRLSCKRLGNGCSSWCSSKKCTCQCVPVIFVIPAVGWHAVPV